MKFGHSHFFVRLIVMRTLRSSMNSESDLFCIEPNAYLDYFGSVNIFY